MEEGVACEILAGVPPLAPDRKVWLEQSKKAEKVNDIEDLTSEDGIKKTNSRGWERGRGRGRGQGQSLGRSHDSGQKRGESSSPPFESSKCKKSKTKTIYEMTQDDSDDEMTDVESQKSKNDPSLYPDPTNYKSHEKKNLRIEQADLEKPSRLENKLLKKETSDEKEKLSKSVVLPPGYGAGQLAAVLVRVLEEKVRLSESHSERQLFRMTIHSLLCSGSGCKATKHR